MALQSCEWRPPALRQLGLWLAAGQLISVNSSLSVTRNADGKVLLRVNPDKKFSADELTVELKGRAGQVEFGGKKFSWSVKKSTGLRQENSKIGAESFDADKIGGEMVLRHWRAGDRFQPIGMTSAVKLQDLFVNAKIPQAERRNLVVAVAEGGEIFWVEHLRIGENFKLTQQTRRKLDWNQSKFTG